MPDSPGAATSPAETTPRGESASRARFPRVRHPATLLIGLSWLVVYLGMAWSQGEIHAVGQSPISGGIRVEVLRQFGSVSSAEVRGGQPWRALTATFLHSSLLHLGFNLLMFYQLGREVETWYGPWQFGAVYAVIGLGSNVLAAWLKPIFRESPTMPSVGGSGVVCGLIALVAVVGWRSKTRIGDYYRAQMVGLLVFIGIVGWLIPGVDNIVHASGAIAGAAVGFLHRRLVRWSGTWRARALGVAALVLAVACALAQARVALVESELMGFAAESRRRAEALARLELLNATYTPLFILRTRGVPERDPTRIILDAYLKGELRRLREITPELDDPESIAAWNSMRALVLGSDRGGPRELAEAASRLATELRREQDEDQKKLAGRLKLLGIDNPVIRIEGLPGLPPAPPAEVPEGDEGT